LKTLFFLFLICLQNINTPTFTSGFVDWAYNDLKIEQASGFHGKNIIVVGICSENPDGKLKIIAFLKLVSEYTDHCSTFKNKYIR
jgi:hypothetical protein